MVLLKLLLKTELTDFFFQHIVKCAGIGMLVGASQTVAGGPMGALAGAVAGGVYGAVDASSTPKQKQKK